MTNIYLGVVEEIYTDPERGITKEYHAVKVKIPTFGEGFIAFPKNGCLDEPKEGDAVLCLDFDPLYHSYMVYETLKESEFIGFRSSGKMLSITPEDLKLGVYDESKNRRDSNNSEEIPELTISSIDMEDTGDINITSNRGNGTITANFGKNGGMVNVGAIRKLIQVVLQDLIAAKSGANLTSKLGEILSELEDNNFKH